MCLFKIRWRTSAEIPGFDSYLNAYIVDMMDVNANVENPIVYK